MTGLMTQIGDMSMDSIEMEREWKRLSQISNNLEDDIRVIEIGINVRQKLLAEKKAEFHAVNEKLVKLGKVMA